MPLPRTQEAEVGISLLPVSLLYTVNSRMVRAMSVSKTNKLARWLSGYKCLLPS